MPKFQMAPQTFHILWVQGKGAQIIHIGVMPEFHTHRECGPKIHPLLHTSDIKDYWLAPLGEDVFSGYGVQEEGQ